MNGGKPELAASSKDSEDWGWGLTSRVIRDLGDVRISSPQFAVLAVIADSVTSDSLTAKIATSTIAKRTHLCRTATMRAIADLEKLGFLSAERTKGRPSRYRVVVSTGAQDASVHQRDRSTRRTDEDHEQDRGGSRKGPNRSSTRTLNQKPKEKPILKQKEKAPGADSGFEFFWSAYPRKVAKEKALKSWTALGIKRPPVADLVAAVERQKSSTQWETDGGKFIPYPATWLNGHRWDDELENDQLSKEDKFGWMIPQNEVSQ